MKNNKFPNRLIEETSPYLHSHAYQDIDWYPWCSEALEKAKNENKLLFISIGYSACHWCNMMSTDCFENETVASVLNMHYVSIKIDREERPDLDQIYLNAVQLLTENSGWPLNCFALPDGTPVFGGTYFTTNQFIDLIQSLQCAYEGSPDKVREVAEDIKESLKNTDIINEKEAFEKLSENDLKLIIEPWKRKFDNTNGGTQSPPKFPLPNGENFLLSAAYYFDDEELKQHITTTLDKMAQGAILDQLGGGFFRYTIDAEWKIPHFEKMLYDNAQLVSLYARAYRFTQNEKYKQICEATLEFLFREMSATNGAFYCSISSDNGKGEGDYYKWSMQEIEEILQEDADFTADYYDINPKENNILYIANDEQELADKYGISVEDVQLKIKCVKDKLYVARLKRELPFVDKKIITAWNAMTISALIEAHVAFNDDKYLTAAKKTAEYIKNNLIHDDEFVYRCISSNHPIEGFLDDYADTIKAFIRLFQVTTEKHYIKVAKSLTDSVIKHFYDKNSGMFFYTSDKQKFSLGRKMDLVDKATPSSCSELTQDLLLIAYIYNDSSYSNIAQQMLMNIKLQMPGAGPFVANWAKLLFYYIYEPIIIKLSKNTLELAHSVWKHFLPNVFILPKISEQNVDTPHSFIHNEYELTTDNVNTIIDIAIKNKRKEQVV